MRREAQPVRLSERLLETIRQRVITSGRSVPYEIEYLVERALIHEADAEAAITSAMDAMARGERLTEEQLKRAGAAMGYWIDTK